MLPVLKRIQATYGFGKPVVVADAGLLSANNLKLLVEEDYPYIIAARIKNESGKIKAEVLKQAGGIVDGGSLTKISVDEEKIKLDSQWAGLKGYITNTRLAAREVAANYIQL